MRDEIISMFDNDVFEIVKKPHGRKIVTCRWVFATKKNIDGNVYRYKARLVARGYSQVHGIDYEEVFAPVVRFDKIRFLLGYAARNVDEVKQGDAKTAFLGGDLEEEIYMEIPSIPKDVMDELLKYTSRKHREKY